MAFEITTDGVRITYLYLVSFATIIISTIGAIMLIHLFITKIVFGLDTLNQWYENPEEQCMHFLEEEYYGGGPYPMKEPYPPFMNEPFYGEDYDGVMAEMAMEAEDAMMDSKSRQMNSQERYDRCVAQVAKRVDHQNKVQLATRTSTGLSMLLVGLPLFFLHWGMVNRRKKVVKK